MGQLYVYDPWPTAVDTMGLCGPLVPTKATCTQEKNGDFRLDIEHPIDQWGKWQSLVPDNLIKADVPLPTVPEFDYAYHFVTSIRAATVLDVSRAARGVTVKSMRVATLPVGQLVYIITTFGSNSMVRWPGGFGWIATSSLDVSATSISLADAPNALEAYVPSPRSRPQLFRICQVETKDDSLTVCARHVFYDYACDMITYTNSNAVECFTALAEINDAGYGFTYGRFGSNITTEATIVGWKRVSTCEAIMSPGDGVVSYWDGRLLRENWDVAYIGGTPPDRGFAIEYGKNLLGVTYSIDTSDVVTQICPIGQTSKGKPLLVPYGDYVVDGIEVSGGPLFNSPSHFDDYPIIRQRAMDYGSGIKAAGTTSAQLNAAYVKLIRAALREFSENHVDLPPVTVSVNFLLLGDTAEYAQYRDLQKLFLHDTVRVKHPRLGIDVTTQVNKTVWDCLLDCYDSIELGSVRKNYARSKLAGWMIPGLDSLKAYVDTIAEQI